MLPGIGGYNSVYGSQSVYNQFRLNQVMQNQGSFVSPVSRVRGVSSQSTSAASSLADSLSYLKNYSSSMTDLMSSANTLRDSNRSGIANQLSASSSDTAVLDAEKRFKLTDAASYEVDVSQVAAAQTNVSNSVASSANAAGNISMEITGSKGNINVDFSAVDTNGNQKTNRQMLAEAADTINKANQGIKATVETKDGQSSLKLQSVNTGSGNAFFVTGDFADKSGITNMTTKAQDAIYSVKENGTAKSYTSGSNDISLGTGKIAATLKKTGTSTITVGTDPSKTVSAMEDLVKSYNSTVSLLDKNTDRGSGTARQLQKLQSYVTGSKESMDQMGLSFNKDGTLSLDKAKLTENLKKDPSLTKDLISGSSGLAQRAYSTAQSGATASVSGLIGNDLAEAQNSQMNDPINTMGNFSRSGAYNMMNYYAVGMMFHSFI